MEIQSPFHVDLSSGEQEDANFADFIFSYIDQYARECGSRPALSDPERGCQWTFADLREKTNKCKERMIELNVRAKSRIALVTSNTPRVLFIYLASAQLGCVVICINGWSSSDEICHQIETVETTHLIVENYFGPKIDEARRKNPIKGLSHCKTIRYLDEVLGDSPRASGKRESNHFLPANFKKRTSDVAKVPKTFLKENGHSSEDEDAMSIATNTNCSFLLSTPLIIFFAYSGSSSTPKPMVVTHQSLIHNLKQISSPIFRAECIGRNTRILLPISIHHIFGTISAFYSLINGSLLITLAKYSPRGLFDALVEHNITHLQCTTTMVQALALEANRLKCDSLQSIIVGGARFDPIAARTCKTKLKIAEFRHMYITTEIGAVCTFAHSKCQNVESVGVPLPGMIFKIANFENNRVCNAPRQLGHLLVSKLTPRVFNNVKATQELYTEDGFVRTGDAAYYDADGYIYIVDRINELIKLGNGHLLCPSEVESALRSRNGIDDCAVIGMDNANGADQTTQSPAVFVVRSTQAAALTAAEIKHHISIKVPAQREFNGSVFFVSEIPRTVGGRILRRRLLQHSENHRNGMGSRYDSVSMLAYTTYTARSVDLSDGVSNKANRMQQRKEVAATISKSTRDLRSAAVNRPSASNKHK